GKPAFLHRSSLAIWVRRSRPPHSLGPMGLWRVSLRAPPRLVNEMGVRLLRAADIALACPMGDAIDAVAAGFAALSGGQGRVPLRSSIPLNGDGVVLTM